MKKILLFVVVITSLCTCSEDEGQHASFELQRAFIGSTALDIGETTENIPLDAAITLIFSTALDQTSFSEAITLRSDNQNVGIDISSSTDNTIILHPTKLLEGSTVYTIEISDQLKSSTGTLFTPASIRFKTKPDDLQITSVIVGENQVEQSQRVTDVAIDLSMFFNFSAAIDMASFKEAFNISGSADVDFTALNEDKTIKITATSPLQYLKKYELKISDVVKGQNGEPFEGYELTFYTAMDSTFKFPEESEEDLLTKIQEQTFKYFWDFAHPVSGLARERNTSGDLVTTGGSGFGVMAILVGIERGFITRKEGVDRLQKIVNFLAAADRFHGVWPHWMDGNTGAVIPFSEKDNGGDLVETALMIQGLLTVKAYLNDADPQEATLKSLITQLWKEVEWDWYTREGEKILYWHWSPDYEWEMNHKIKGWNEALIVYVLAASSPTHGIDAEVYHQGWAGNGSIQNGYEYYGIKLPLGSGKGGPLFFAHYSFLGLDPRNLEDQYAHYWDQNVNHTLINRAYSIDNPQHYVGYGANSWGLTASDNHEGYSAHSPDNDLGVITPTAAISSIPYTPEESKAALKHFYYLLGDKLWGDYGFYDAFNLTEEWTANSYLAIDQGPIIIMIENYRTGMLWDLFMSNDDISNGLKKLNFTSY